MASIKLKGSTSGEITISVPAVAGTNTLTIPASSGSINVVNFDQTVKTANFTATSNSGYFVNTTSGAITITLPASPSAWEQISIIDYAGTFGTNNLTLDPNGNNIYGLSISNASKLNKNYTSVTLVYIDATKGWVILNNNSPEYSALTQSLAVDILLAAGGGGGQQYQGGSAGGGGGAGGLIYIASYPISYATTYTITVGAGGAKTTSTVQAGEGSNTTFASPSATLLTGIGGGGGGTPVSASGTHENGGSVGGGGEGVTTYGTAQQPIQSGDSGTYGFGNIAGFYSGNCGCSGGGAGGRGQTTGVTTNVPSIGGAGKSYSITGSSVTYCVGGDAGCYVGPSSSNEPANTGNAGNGGANSYTAGNGGSGVLIIRVPDTQSASATTGSPTILTPSGYNVYKFTASGSITF